MPGRSAAEARNSPDWPLRSRRGTSSVKRVPGSRCSTSTTPRWASAARCTIGRPEAGAADLAGHEGFEEPVAHVERDSGAVVGDVHGDRIGVDQRTSCAGVTCTCTRPRSPTACTALSTRLNTARCSRSSSPATSHAPAAMARRASPARRWRSSGAAARAPPRPARPLRRPPACSWHGAGAGEVEELAEQPAEAVGLAHGEREECLLVFVGDAAPLVPTGQLFRGAPDGRQRVPDLVRQRGAQLGDGLQPLRAHVQRLQPLGVGDVLEDGGGGATAAPLPLPSRSAMVVVTPTSTVWPSRRMTPSTRSRRSPSMAVRCSTSASSGETPAREPSTGRPTRPRSWRPSSSVAAGLA